MYGAATQDTIPPDETGQLDKDKFNITHQVVGVYLCYGRQVDDNKLQALSAIISE